jgi:hypothetical protein
MWSRMIYRNPFVDHTLRLIQLNWVILSYNFNIVIWVLIIWDSRYRCISTFHFTTALPCYTLHNIYFLHLWSTYQKCTQPCFFPLQYKSAAQKVKMDWNSSMRSSKLALPQLLFLWCLGAFRWSAFASVTVVFNGQYLCNKLHFIRDIWLSMNTFSSCVWNNWSWAHMWWVLGFAWKIKNGTRWWWHGFPLVGGTACPPYWWRVVVACLGAWL